MLELTEITSCTWALEGVLLPAKLLAQFEQWVFVSTACCGLVRSVNSIWGGLRLQRNRYTVMVQQGRPSVKLF